MKHRNVPTDCCDDDILQSVGCRNVNGERGGDLICKLYTRVFTLKTIENHRIGS